MIKFSIPIIAPTLNKWYAGNHWTQRKKVADEWHLAVLILCRQDNIKPVESYPVCITTKTYFKTNRKRDTSNCFPANKLAEDALVKAGILKDDTPQYVSKHIVYLPEFGQHRDETVITVSYDGKKP